MLFFKCKTYNNLFVFNLCGIYFLHFLYNRHLSGLPEWEALLLEYIRVQIILGRLKKGGATNELWFQFSDVKRHVVMLDIWQDYYPEKKQLFILIT